MTVAKPYVHNASLSWLKTAARITLRVSGVFGAVIVAGFAVFAISIEHFPQRVFHKADGIVALTGGEDRIQEAVRLLGEGRGRRLLITGVNPTTDKLELVTYNGLSTRDVSLFRCCVDLDKRALNTEENAQETTAWARRKGYRSIVVVTSAYHMPRTLIELRQSMPHVTLIPFPVKSERMEHGWWSNKQCARVMLKEYVKFLTAVTRYAARVLNHRHFNDEITERVVAARVR